jgi:peptidoglycan/xylan/chitin deacetylase (PgdA/CDA1 family)
MAGNPPRLHISSRRSRRQARIRRRRLTALAVAIAVLALAVVLIVGTGGDTTKSPTNAANSSSSPQPKPGGQPKPTGAEAIGNARIQKLAQLGLPVYCAGPHGNAVAFTFDDGPGPYTHYAIKKLTDAGQRATFFVVGRSMDNFPGWLPREQKVGVIADHSYTHPVLTSLSPSGLESELLRTKQKIEATSGQHVDLFRPPYGARNALVDQAAKRLGMLEIVWNIDSADSAGANYAGITRNVEAGLHPGSIILMHENRGQTIRALTTILPYMQAHHIRSVTLPELFASDPPSAAQLRQGPAGCSSKAAARSGA